MTTQNTGFKDFEKNNSNQTSAGGTEHKPSDKPTEKPVDDQTDKDKSSHSDQNQPKQK